MEHPELDTALVERWGFRLSRGSLRSSRAPLLGEHNDLVFQEIVGLSEDEINNYIVQDVFR